MRLVLTIVVFGPALVVVGVLRAAVDIAATFRDLAAGDAVGRWS
jgi:hypothetical protein